MGCAIFNNYIEISLKKIYIQTKNIIYGVLFPCFLVSLFISLFIGKYPVWLLVILRFFEYSLYFIRESVGSRKEEHLL